MKAPTKKTPNRIDDQTRETVIGLASTADKKLSMKEISRRTGISDKSVARILKNAGVIPDHKSKHAADTKTRQRAKGTSTLRTIAAEAGVSVATVSLAMRDSHKISITTKTRVMEVAERLNYRKSPAISRYMNEIRHGRIKRINEKIGYLVSQHESDCHPLLESPWGPLQKYEAAKLAAYRLGYDIEIFNLDEEPGLEKRLYNMGIRGLIIDAPLGSLFKNGFKTDPFTSISFQKRMSRPTHAIGHDLYNNMLLCFCQLWLRGYRKIGYISSDLISQDTQFVSNAAFACAQEHLCLPEWSVPILYIDSQLTVEKFDKGQTQIRFRERDPIAAKTCEGEDSFKNTIYSADSFPKHMVDHIKQWLDTYQPEVIIWENEGAKTLLEKLGYNIPKDLALVHLNLHRNTENWSGIRRAERQMAKIAVEHLCMMLESAQNYKSLEKCTMYILGDWVDGDTAPKKQSPIYPLTETALFWISNLFPSLV